MFWVHVPSFFGGVGGGGCVVHTFLVFCPDCVRVQVQRDLTSEYMVLKVERICFQDSVIVICCDTHLYRFKGGGGGGLI